MGTLRSLDQYSNLVLEDSFERHIVEDKYSDIYLGLYVVRGESVVMVGEIVSASEYTFVHHPFTFNCYYFSISIVTVSMIIMTMIKIVILQTGNFFCPCT